MKNKIKTILFRIFIFVITGFLATNCTESFKSPVDMEAINKTEARWEQLRCDSVEIKGHMIVQNHQLPTFYLYWQPLTKANQNLIIDSARQIVFRFWQGFNQPKLSGNQREIAINGHKVFVIDGMNQDETIQMRFFVWNCLESQRLFIAESTIDLRLNTPESLLNIQEEFAKTVNCHGQSTTQNAQLPQVFQAAQFKISFNLPNNWRAAELIDRIRYPMGMNESNGSLFAVMTDSKRDIHILWDKSITTINKDVLNNCIEELKKTTWISKADTSKKIITTNNLIINGINQKTDFLEARGTWIRSIQYLGNTDFESYRFRAYLWKSEGKTWFMITSVISLMQFWQNPIDLSPSDQTIDEVIKGEVLPSVVVFDKKELL